VSKQTTNSKNTRILHGTVLSDGFGIIFSNLYERLCEPIRAAFIAIGDYDSMLHGRN
jgi:hypothetical protein